MNSLDRRGFLGAAVATTLGMSSLQARQQPPAIPFGFSLYGMRSLSLDDALAACAKIGYDAVELAVMPGWPADPRSLNKDARRRLRERLRTLNLQLAALMENTPPDADDKVHRTQLDRLQAAAELGRELSPDATPVIETILGGPAGQWDKLRQRFADRVASWAQVAAKTRTVIAVKPHRSNAMNLPEQGLWLLKQVNSDWIRLGYDYSHFQFRQLTVADTLKAMLSQTRFVHVKDVRLDKGRVRFLLPGEGTIDYVDLFTRLRTSGYRGCVCVEVSGMIHSQIGYDPVATARRCYQNLAPAFQKAGIRRGT